METNTATQSIRPASEQARRFGCTIAQAARMLIKNAEGFDVMAERAKAKGGKYNGYTTDQLIARAAAYREAATK